MHRKKSKFLLKSCIFQEVPKVTKYILRTSYIVNMLQLTKNLYVDFAENLSLKVHTSTHKKAFKIFLACFFLKT